MSVRIRDVEPRLLRLLGLVSLALFFESYDLSMLTSALKHIADDLGMADADLGGYLGTIRLGALPALALVGLADRFGRRRLFLASLLGVSVTTVATAFAGSPDAFVAWQMLTRVFMVTGTSVAIVIVTEEFPAAVRGWAIGAMGAIAASGHGLGALLFSQIERLPYGWRALYVAGAFPLLLFPAFVTGVPETARFTRRAATAGAAIGGALAPLVALARSRPERVATLTAAVFLVSLGDVSVFQFTSYFAQTVHGWSPQQYATMFIAAGALGVAGNLVAGRASDLLGRRTVGMAAFMLFPSSAALFYNGPATTMPLAFAAFVFCQTAGVTILRAVSTELFPTSHRGAGATWATLVQTIGWASGLWLVGLGAAAPDDIAATTTRLALAVLAGGLLLLALPETGRRELEAISPEAGDG